MSITFEKKYFFSVDQMICSFSIRIICYTHSTLSYFHCFKQFIYWRNKTKKTKKNEYYTIASGKYVVFFIDELRNISFFFVIFIGCNISTGGVMLRLLFVVVQFVWTINCCVIVPLLFVLDGDEPPCCCGFSIVNCVWGLRQLYSRFRWQCPRFAKIIQIKKFIIKISKILNVIINIYFKFFMSDFIDFVINDEWIIGERWVEWLYWYEISYKFLHVFNKSILNGWLDRLEIRLLKR